jgi:hypothetical protein
MPRYRFSWATLPPSLLRELGLDLDLQPAGSRTLTGSSGTRA